MSDVIVKSEPLTYERNAPHSFFLDVARASTLKDDDAIKRLSRHAVETRTNPNGTLGTGGEFIKATLNKPLNRTAREIQFRQNQLFSNVHTQTFHGFK